MDNRNNTLFLGKVLLEYERLDSTNSQAERLLKEGKVTEGSVILTHDQFSGRGQMGNIWFNDKFKNLTFSIVLYPKFLSPKRQFLLSQIITLGLHDCLREYLDHVSIKWPNDIMVGNKKIAGILIQNSISKQSLSHSIIGLGINVNQDTFPNGIGNPTSFFLETKKVFDLDELLADFCKKIEVWYLRLKSGKTKEINSEYHNRLFLKDKTSFFIDKKNTIFKGRILGVNTEGKLIIETTEGIKSFMFKEVSLK